MQNIETELQELFVYLFDPDETEITDLSAEDLQLASDIKTLLQAIHVDAEFVDPATIANVKSVCEGCITESDDYMQHPVELLQTIIDAL